MEQDYESIEDYLSNEFYDTVCGSDGCQDWIAAEDGTQIRPMKQIIFLYGYNVIIVGIGIVLNIVLIKGILSAKASGAFLFLVQIAIVDVLTLLISNWELHYLFQRAWTLPSVHCSLYRGFDSFTSVATVYLIVGLNFHAIATYNLAVDIAKSTLATPEQECAENSVSTEENGYEVTTDAISQKRSLTIDYRYRKTRIPVLFPILLVWFIAVSESLPVFLFSDVNKAPDQEQTKQCGILTNTSLNNFAINWLVIGIRIVIPTVALVITTVQVVIKFHNGKHFPHPDEVDENVAFALKLSIFLSVSYLVFAMQRLYGSLLQELLSVPLVVSKYALANSSIGLILTVCYYSISFIRPLVIIVLCKQKNNHVDINFIHRKKVVPAREAKEVLL
ncbi:uncharacterized protein LOC118459770 [Anopheles albimanus]|uniref:G-protein coupled receptors family 1 profile domain-containing protein n=1 Tax=Anopheles albimanus TaxID=7167 RepID=A0A182FN58_ANOAL|nr:uncharacterized protein LOC118459770 [Anopheles albimanus]